MPRPTVNPMKLRFRHVVLLLSFAVFVLAPTVGAFFYLYTIAADQYVSRVAFTVRSEELRNPMEALQSLGGLSSGGTTDSDILYDYILSQKLVENISARLDLEEIYSRPDYDPVFAYTPGQPIEKLTQYWERMVGVSFDSTVGVIRLDVYAFTADDAHAIANVIVEESDELVNELSQISREDTTRFAREDLEAASERLKDLRLELAEFRSTHQIIDPTIDLNIRMGVVTALQQQLASVLVQRDSLLGTTRENDPRLNELDRQIEALEGRIAQERDSLAQPTLGQQEGFVSLMSTYESLLVDLEFAQQVYLVATGSYDAALAEARRRSRYLATHIPPTYPQSAEYPSRLKLGLTVFGISFLFWMISVFTVYAARDRS